VNEGVPVVPGPAMPISDSRPRPVQAPEGLAPGSLRDWLSWGESELAASSDSPRADVEILLAALLGIPRSNLALRHGDALETATVLALASRIERRRLGEPVAYITGRQGFWTLDLIVDTSVLIPRPDTETLVEWALETLRGMRPSPRVLDLGTGSAAIALSLAEARSDAVVTATDLSADALELARQNAREHGIGNVAFCQGSWFEAVKQAGGASRFDLIVSNPPYIAEGDAHLAALRFEPRLALTAGPDGLDAVREIIRLAPEHLVPGGWLLLEHGHDQAEAVRVLLREAGFAEPETRRDFGGHERVSGGRLVEGTSI